MKSRVLTTIDPASVDISAYIKLIPVDEAKLNAEIRHILNPFNRWEKADTLLEGGMAVVRLASDIDRFNKEKVKFVAGSGMFNRVIENAVIGLTVGESTSVSLPDGEVTATLIEATNRIVPELTDEIAAKAGIEGVATAAELQEHLIRRQKRDAAESMSYEPYNYLMQEVIRRSEFVIAKEDWKTVVSEKLHYSRTLFELAGLDIEKAGPEEFAGKIPVNSYHEFLVMLQDEAWDMLSMYLLGREYAREDGFAPTDEEYEKMLADYAKAWHYSEQESRRINSRKMFEIGEYIGRAADKFRSIVIEKILKEDQ